MKILGVVSQIRYVLCVYRRADTKYPILSSRCTLHTHFVLQTLELHMRFPVEIIALNYFFCSLFLCLLTCQT
jgi:hypothetical protein